MTERLRPGFVALAALLVAACAHPDHYRPNRPLDAERFSVSCEGDFEQGPTLAAGKSPVYPVRMLNPDVIEDRKIRHLPMEWWVTTSFTVGADGATSEVRSTPTSPQSFGDHMTIAVRSWRFEPASKQGVAVSSRCSSRFGFSLQ